MDPVADLPAATETTVRESLQELITLAADEFDVAEMLSDEAGDLLADAETGSFEDLGMLTSNEGFTLRLANGSEYQVTIVRSR